MKLALNKSSLKSQRDHLAMYERFLPSLDLKRKQLVVEHQKCRERLSQLDRESVAMAAAQSGLMALLGGTDLDLSNLVSVKSTDKRTENVLGVTLPKFANVSFRIRPYSMLAKPFWVDFLVEALQTAATQRVRRQIEVQREGLLAEAVRRVTQRVNLFEQVLMPEARQNIQRIQLFLDEADRAAVVRSKIAKAKHTSRELRGVT